MTSRPHVLGVLHLAEMSGPARSLRPWLERVARGGRLEVAVPGAGAAAELYRPVAEIATLPYAALVLPRSPLAALRFAATQLRQLRIFRAQLRRSRPDLVVVATSTLPAALAAARLERVPAIVYVGEIVPTGPGLARAVGGRALVTATRALAGEVVCCSHAAASAFGGSGRVSVVSPGIARFAGGDGERLRRRHGLERARPCVVAVGNVSRRRGQDVLLRALALVRPQLPEIGCLLVGAPHPRSEDVAFERELHALVAELGLDGAVGFAGYVDGVADAYAAADIVVNPIRGPEGLGRAGLEALAAGRPVIASRVGGVSEALRDGRHALLVEPGDAAALAAALVRLAEDGELSRRLVESGGEHVRSAYALERGAEAFAAVASRLTAE